ncbi:MULTISPECIES: type II toxin-antitoxin system RelE/ParE family toxin [unclassified Pannonibacter]|uniref:type II toxin-antitoxin system RelE/ParE family toxin n=1 Tax=unclassified Pannonibacter TaxID=2627228 RepID=UPI001648FD09|nr:MULTISPECIES: type II toxin-antitoxin system RelE/ParE family toxin [unclassified Pannonibacter]
MARAVFSPRAEADLRDIWRTIAFDNEPAANALLLRLIERAGLAATQPHMGRARPELSATARILVEGRYIVIYEPREFGILVVAIVYGARDLETWLD